MSRLMTGLLLVTALLVSGCDRTTAEERLQRARAFYAEQEIESAAIELKALLQEEPRNAGARRFLGELYLAVDDGIQAEKELGRAVELGVPRGELVVAIARARLLQEKYEKIVDEAIGDSALRHEETESLPVAQRAELFALQGHAFLGLRRVKPASRLYERALALDPMSVEATVGEARIVAAQVSVEDAKRKIETLLQRDPEFTDGWRFLGTLERHQGNAKAAEAAYSKAIDTGSYQPADWFNRALIRISLSDYGGAEADIVAVEKRVKREAGSAYARGLIASRQRDFEAAHSRFQEAVSIDSDYMPAVLFLGLTSTQLGQLATAQQHLTRFLSANPSSDVAAKALAGVLVKLGDKAGVEAALRPVLARSPDDELAREMLAVAVMQQGRYQEGVMHFEKLVARHADSPDAHLKLGLGMLAAGQEEEGLKAISRAADLAEDDPSAELALIRQHLRAKRYAEALEIAEVLRAQKPDSPVSISLVALVRMAMSDDVGARSLFQEALQLEPGFPLAIHSLARLELRQERLGAARSLYQQGLEAHPNDLSMLLALADVEARSGNSAESERLMETAVERHPGETGPRILLARHYARTGRPEEALAVLEPVPERPANVSLLMVKGAALLDAGRPAQAAKTLEELIAIAPQNAEAHFLLARVMAQMGDGARVREELAKAVELAPDQFRPGVAYVRLLTRQGDLEEAEGQLEGMRTRFSADEAQAAELDVLEAEVALAGGDTSRAVAAYQRARSFQPSMRLTISLAHAHLRAGDRGAAAEVLKAWIEEHPEDAPVFFALGEYHEAAGELQEALSAYERTIALVPTHVLALNNAAWILRDRDVPRARQHAEAAAKLAPANPSILDTAGIVNLEAGHPDRAVELLEQAVKLAPENESIALHFAQSLTAHGDRDRARKVLTRLLDSGSEVAERREAKDLASELGVE